MIHILNISIIVITISHAAILMKTTKVQNEGCIFWKVEYVCMGPCTISIRWTPHPVLVTSMDNKDYIRVLSYSYYTTITGWGVLLKSQL